MPTLPRSPTLPRRGKPKATVGMSSSNTVSSMSTPTASSNTNVRYETSIKDARCGESDGTTRGEDAEAEDKEAGVGLSQQGGRGGHEVRRRSASTGEGMDTVVKKLGDHVFRIWGGRSRSPSEDGQEMRLVFVGEDQGKFTVVTQLGMGKWHVTNVLHGTTALARRFQNLPSVPQVDSRCFTGFVHCVMPQSLIPLRKRFLRRQKRHLNC